MGRFGKGEMYVAKHVFCNRLLVTELWRDRGSRVKKIVKKILNYLRILEKSINFAGAIKNYCNETLF